MNTRLIIPLEELTQAGDSAPRYLEGELDGAVFGIDTDDVQSAGPLSYELNLQLFETELLIRGSISAPFRFRCARCLEYFTHTIALEDISLSEDISQQLELDLTEALREEILLELPDYPKCEMEGKECQFEVENDKNDKNSDFRLDKDPQTGVDSATPSGKSVWDALDQFPKN